MSYAMYAAATINNDERYFSKSEIRIRNNRRRRQRIARMQRLVVFTAATLILVIGMFVASTLMTDARSDNKGFEYKYYTTMIVHTGDTLWNIATENFPDGHYKNVNAYINEICNINGICEADSLKAGESLILPYFSSEFVQ